jgi:hypothetical protein
MVLAVVVLAGFAAPVGLELVAPAGSVALDQLEPAALAGFAELR